MAEIQDYWKEVSQEKGEAGDQDGDQSKAGQTKSFLKSYENTEVRTRLKDLHAAEEMRWKEKQGAQIYKGQDVRRNRTSHAEAHKKQTRQKKHAVKKVEEEAVGVEAMKGWVRIVDQTQAR